ncbi:hypothetical protein Hanom_Chr09g00801501 [Helianthus anomalus]
MATVNIQPWRIYPPCLIVYKSEPYNRFITSTTVLYICYVFGFGTFNDARTHNSGTVTPWLLRKRGLIWCDS